MSSEATVQKPECALTGTDGNVFSVIANVSRALKRAGQKDRADEFRRRALASDSYDAVLILCHEFVEVC